MSFFNDDPFEDIVREFFGSGVSQRRKNGNTFVSNEEEERTIDFIEDDAYVYVLFEIPGYAEKDCTVSLKKNELVITLKKNALEGVQPYLAQKFSQGEVITKTLPQFITPKNFKQTVKNGILELTFLKK